VRIGELRHRQPEEAYGQPDQVLRQGGQVVRGKVQPEYVVEFAAEKEVRVITLCDIRVFVLEGLRV
jgi:hypothetical protein